MHSLTRSILRFAALMGNPMAYVFVSLLIPQTDAGVRKEVLRYYNLSRDNLHVARIYSLGNAGMSS